MIPHQRDPQFTPGFPRYFWHDAKPIIYELKLQNGSLVKAYVLTDRQYAEEGLQWCLVASGAVIPKHTVEGWREVEEG